jgi:hypothetical protein
MACSVPLWQEVLSNLYIDAGKGYVHAMYMRNAAGAWQGVCAADVFTCYLCSTLLQVPEGQEAMSG